DLRYHPRVLLRYRKAGPVQRRPIGEQSNCVAAEKHFGTTAALRPRQSEGGDSVDLLAVDLQRLPAAGQERQLRTRAKQAFGETGAGVDKMLAVVQDEQHALPLKRFDQGVLKQAVRLFL